MKIEQDKQAADYARKLQQRQKNIISAQEAELKNISKRFDNQKQNIKYQGEKDLLEARTINKENLLGQTERHTEVLQKLQDRSEQNRIQMDNERNLIRSGHSNRINDIQLKSDQQIISKIHQSNEKSKELEVQTKQLLKQINSKANSDVLKTNISSNQRVLENVKRNNDRINNQDEVFKQQFEIQKSSFADRLAHSKLDHSNEMRRIERDQTNQKTDLLKRHEYQTNFEKNLHKHSIEQAEESFKIKYKQLVGNHDTVLKRLELQFSDEMNEKVLGQSGEKDLEALKSKDQFYRISSIEPIITENKDSFLFRLNIPAHEADNVHFSSYKKKVRIDLTRRFSKEINGDNGNKDSSKRTEILTKTLFLDSYLNPKSLEKSYANGILTFKIEKES